MGETFYHVELRHFPRNVCRFNMSPQELRATVLEPWLADRTFELGELRWDPRHARLKVLEGPHLNPAQLTMGRGWRAAERRSQDVTERLLAAAGRAPEMGEKEDAGDPTADSLGLELLAQIGVDQAPLRRAWELAAARNPSGTASDALALAERAVASLLRTRLVVLLRSDPPATPSAASPPAGEGHGGSGVDLRPVRDEDAAAVLRALDSWSEERASTRVYLRRA